MTLKVIGAGWGRTGTASLKIALEQLGFGPCHHMYVLITNGLGNLEAWKKAVAGTLTNWDEIYGEFGSTTDFPHCMFYRQLAEFYPAAKVVLTERDPDAWYRSAIGTIFSEETRRERERVGGPLTAVFSVIEGIMPAAHNYPQRKDELIAAYLAHNAEVKRVIPPERLLVYDVAQGWEPLCRFLGVPAPAEPFPLTNTGDDFRAQRGSLGMQDQRE